MKDAISRNKYVLILFLTFLFAELLVYPIGEFPLNDDWSYSKSVLIFCNENAINIGEWPAMTLVTHILWGSLFTKLFGFSFLVLRLSTLLSSFVGLLLFYRLITKLSGDRSGALLGSMVLLFNPIYFNLGNTFMTDVNFNTLLILACNLAYDYHQKNKPFLLLLLLLVSCALVLMRQFGIVLPACFAISCLFAPEKKIQKTALAILITLVTYLVLIYYEKYLRTVLTSGAAYKFSGSVQVLDATFLANLPERIGTRLKAIIVHVSIYTLPLLLPHIDDLRKRVPLRVFLVSSAAGLLLSLTFFFTHPPFQGNIFGNMSLGPDTFYENLTDISANNSHTYSKVFAIISEIIKHLAVCSFMTFILIRFYHKSHIFSDLRNLSPAYIFLAATILGYCGALLLSDSFFDRYNLPVITLVLMILGARLPGVNYGSVAGIAALFILVLSAYASIAGTRDYFEVNRTRWAAYYDLRKDDKISARSINGGFEVNCWNEGQPGWWANVLTTEYYDYMIQYTAAPGFLPLKKYPFKRIFPLRSDTLTVSKKITPPGT